MVLLFCVGATKGYGHAYYGGERLQPCSFISNRHGEGCFGFWLSRDCIFPTTNGTINSYDSCFFPPISPPHPSPQRPVYKSKSSGDKWTRLRNYVHFTKAEDGGYPQLMFEHNLDQIDDELFFAFTYPYTYTMVQDDMALVDAQSQRMDANNPDSIYCTRELLARSCDGLRVDLVTISSCRGISADREREPRLPGLFPTDDTSNTTSATAVQPRAFVFPDKEVVFVSARVHPGEVPAQHTFKGILSLLLDPHDLQAKALRQRYVFKLIPMLNPDGVYRGHFRMDQMGENLNRYYVAPNPIAQPTIFAAKSLLDFYATSGKLCLYLDLHAHASKRGCFIYGNVMDTLVDQVQNQLFCRLIALNTPHFDYEGCLFSREHMKRIDPGDLEKGLTAEGSGRVATYLAHRLIHSYTLECNYNMSRVANEVPACDTDPGGALVTPASSFNSNPTEKYTPALYAGVGRACIVALLDIRGHNPCSRIPNSKLRTLEKFRQIVTSEVRNRKEYRNQSSRPPLSGGGSSGRSGSGSGRSETSLSRTFWRACADSTDGSGYREEIPGASTQDQAPNSARSARSGSAEDSSGGRPGRRLSGVRPDKGSDKGPDKAEPARGPARASSITYKLDPKKAATSILEPEGVERAGSQGQGSQGQGCVLADQGIAGWGRRGSKRAGGKVTAFQVDFPGLSRTHASAAVGAPPHLSLQGGSDQLPPAVAVAVAVAAAVAARGAHLSPTHTHAGGFSPPHDASPPHAPGQQSLQQQQHQPKQQHHVTGGVGASASGTHGPVAAPHSSSSSGLPGRQTHPHPLTGSGSGSHGDTSGAILARALALKIASSPHKASGSGNGSGSGSGSGSGTGNGSGSGSGSGVSSPSNGLAQAAHTLAFAAVSASTDVVSVTPRRHRQLPQDGDGDRHRDERTAQPHAQAPAPVHNRSPAKAPASAPGQVTRIRSPVAVAQARMEHLELDKHAQVRPDTSEATPARRKSFPISISPVPHRLSSPMR